MSTDAPQPTEWLAIAFLVEASFTLSHDWKQLYRDYIGQLLQRCTIFPNPNKPARVAFVTYGTADTRPSPIVKKIFFTETHHIIQDIKDGSRRLGIGLTGSGSGKGMAALEGFATILDMFDQLRNLAPKDLRVVHIAASPPDNSQHPCWNQLPLLDSLTWELLPVELKKRNIQLSGINTSSELACFTELYTQAAAGNPTAPWFNVEKLHYLFINGFTGTPRIAKRVAEVIVPDCTPEPKRARVVPQQTPVDTSTPDISVQASMPAPSMQLPISTSPTALPTGSNVSQSNSQSVPQTGHQSNQNIPLMARHCMARMQAVSVKRRQLEDEMKLIIGQRNVILPQGDTEQLNFFDAEIVKRRDTYQKLTQILVALQRFFRRLDSQSQDVANAQKQDDSEPSQPNSSAPMTKAETSPTVLPIKDPPTPFNPATTPRQPSTVQSPIVNPRVIRSITSGVSTSSPNLNPPNTPVAPMVTNPLSGVSGLTAQMQKLLQVDRSRLPVGVTSSTGVPVMSTESTVMAVDPIQPLQQQLQPSTLNQIVSVLVWEGILSFNGTGTGGSKKEVHTRVSASSSNASNSHSETWPAAMTLRPAQTPAVSMPDFQDWIRRTKPVLCTFKAEALEDEAAYSMLVSVMSAKSIYATASWQLQSGVVKENALIFPINNIGLCGAFFPLTGIPEMPQAPPVASNPGYPIPRQITNIIAQLAPEQRAVVVNQLRLNLATSPEAAGNFFRVLVRQQQQQQQNRAAMANQFGLNSNAVQSGSMADAAGSGHNTMSVMDMNMNAMGSMGNVPSMIPNMPRTGGGPTTGMNVNYDVLQSFMQRNNNTDGNSGSGMSSN